MKIKELCIDGYKNLQNASLKHEGDLMTIIGNNGSGKSNFLEALSCIFKSLYRNKNDIPFDFSLSYTNSDNKNIKITKNKSSISFFVDGTRNVSIKEYLPKKVIAIYSGEENRLWTEYYEQFYKDYISGINDIKNHMQAQLPQMLYLNKYYWGISLLCLILSSKFSEGNKSFLKAILKIQKIDKIQFSFSKSHYAEYKNNPVLNFVRMIDHKTEYTLNEFVDVIDKSELFINEIFTYLYVAFTPEKNKIINNISIMFDNGLQIEDLSEGQKKLLLIKGALEFAGQEDTLYLLDEPDSHVHVNNKNKIIDAFKDYKANRQIIITTHSPTITQAIDEKNNLYMMKDGEFIDKEQQEIIKEITGEFWDAHQQNSFLGSDKDILLVEGKTDITHIETALSKLKERYPKYKQLNFEYLPVGGASGLQLFIDKFKLNKNKRGFAFLDRDKAGIDAIKKTLNMNDTKDFQGTIKNNIYIDLLPKKEDFSKNNFVIEDYYKFETYKNYIFKDIDCANELPNPKNIKVNFSETCKNFNIDEFEGFKVLFDLILKIK